MFANLYLTCRKSKKSLALTFFALTLFIYCAAALSPQSAAQTSNNRAKTVKALQAINQGRWTVGRDIIAQTKDPLASKLYYWLVYTDKNEPSRFSGLTQFIRNNPEWPGARDLRLSAEKNMPLSLPLADVVEWFGDYAPRTPDGMDHGEILVEKIITGNHRNFGSAIFRNAPECRFDASRPHITRRCVDEVAGKIGGPCRSRDVCKVGPIGRHKPR